jgi:hypothetical protein
MVLDFDIRLGLVYFFDVVVLINQNVEGALVYFGYQLFVIMSEMNFAKTNDSWFVVKLSDHIVDGLETFRGDDCCQFLVYHSLGVV